MGHARPAAAHKAAADAILHFDAVVIGAGVSGLYQLYKLRALGLQVRVLETGTGVGGVSLREKLDDGPQTFLGILVDGFPNMLMVLGPHAGLGNFPSAVEDTADWVTGLIRFAHDCCLTRVEATAAGAVAWTEHVIESSEGLLFTEVDSWMTGINRNVEGEQVRRIMRYSGGHPAFRKRCDAVTADGYRELVLA
jgi:cation diffusion facilitator CzcD-associated flavoprotein CzcO